MLAPWAKEEMVSVDLGDERLDSRVVAVLSALGSRPTVSIPAACGGRAEMQAAYRFFNNDKVTFDKVLQPHIERTLTRASGAGLVVTTMKREYPGCRPGHRHPLVSRGTRRRY
jgi:hypothetical protein